MGFLTSASQDRQKLVRDVTKTGFSLTAHSDSHNARQKNLVSQQFDIQQATLHSANTRSGTKSFSVTSKIGQNAANRKDSAGPSEPVLLPNGRMAAVSGSFAGELRVLCAVPYQTIWCAERDGGLNCRDAMNGDWVSWIKPPDVRVKNRYFPTCIVVNSCFDVWIGSTIGVIDVYDGYSASFKRQLQGHHGQVSCLLSAGDLNAVISGGNDFSIACWNVHTYSELWRLHRNDNYITSMAMSLPFLVSGSASGQVKFWKLSAERQPVSLAATYPHRRKVTALAVCNNFLVCASEDGSLKLMSLASQRVLQVFSFNKNTIATSLNVTAETIWIGCTDGRIRFLDIHDVRNGDSHGILHELENKSSAITGFYEAQRHTTVLLHVLTGKNNMNTYLHQPLESKCIHSEYSMSALLTSMDSLHLHRTKLWGLNASISVANETLKANTSRIMRVNEMVGNSLVSSFSRAERCLSFHKLLLIASKPRSRSCLKENKDIKLLRQFYTRLRPMKEKKQQEAHVLRIYKTMQRWRETALLRKFYSSWNSCLKLSKKEKNSNQKRTVDVSERGSSAIKNDRITSVEQHYKKRLLGKVERILSGKVQTLFRGLIFEKWKCLAKIRQAPSVKYVLNKTTRKVDESRGCARKLRAVSANLHRLSRKALLLQFFQRWLESREGHTALSDSQQATRRDEIALTTERLSKNSFILESSDPIAEVNANRQRILAAQSELKRLLEIAEGLESEYMARENKSSQHPNLREHAEEAVLCSLSDQERMMKELIRLKAKSVLCHRDLKEIKRIHDIPTKELPALLKQAIFTCAQYIHKIHETDYYPTNGGRWELDISASSGNSLVAFRKEVLYGIRTALVARDCIVNRDDLQSSLTNSIQLDLTREILSNIDIMTALVDRFSKGHVFCTRAKLASTEGNQKALHAVSRKPLSTKKISL